MIDWKQVCKDDISDRTILLTGNGKFEYKINKKRTILVQLMKLY